MAAFKPAYLIHGDDHGRIGERRARLRELAEAQSGPEGLEVFTGEAATGEAVAVALAAMTFAVGRRFLIVDGVERWSESEVGPVVTALAELPPDTTVAFFARDEGRLKAPPGLVAAVKSCGGDVAHESAVKPWELPRWVLARASELGLDVAPAAAKVLVALVGERQQRLLRELEKLALSADPGARIDVDDVERVAAGSAERRAWSLADAVVARDGGAAVRLYLDLRAQGERLAGLLYLVTQRLRAAHELSARLEAGHPAAQLKKTLRMPPKAAERFLSDVQGTDAGSLRGALETMADLELASRGGAAGVLDEDTLAITAFRRLAAA
jgi:DNA polymerase-3 subunit delta